MEGVVVPSIELEVPTLERWESPDGRSWLTTTFSQGQSSATLVTEHPDILAAARETLWAYEIGAADDGAPLGETTIRIVTNSTGMFTRPSNWFANATRVEIGPNQFALLKTGTDGLRVYDVSDRRTRQGGTANLRIAVAGCPLATTFRQT